jgi:hypothetical protein
LKPRAVTHHAGRPLRSDALWRGAHLLLTEVPDFIWRCGPIADHGLDAGMLAVTGHWRGRIAAGALNPIDMVAAIVPVTCLAAGLLEALLRATPIDQRAALFDNLAEETGGALRGSPQTALLRTGLV